MASLLRERAGTPPFVKPFLYALDRLQERRALRPDELVARARAILDDRFGVTAEPVETAFAYGATGLLGSHTHYFDGFALLMSLPLGTALAVRRAEGGSRVFFEGSEQVWTFDRTEAAGADGVDRPVWTCLVEALVREIVPDGAQVDVAVVSTVHASCMDAYLSALGIAAARGLQALFAASMEAPVLYRLASERIASCLGCPESVAFPMTADVGHPGHYTLVDTHTLEHLPLEAPAPEQLGWGFVDVGGRLRESSFYSRRLEETQEITEMLRRGPFEQLRSLRDLEHRDLERALEVLPPDLRPLLRHLVTENRRVQKMVVAIRRGDWQMFGALLFMSHASLRMDWKATTEMVDFVVQEVEAMSLEGMYGACVTSRGGCVLLVGQPFALPRCLDRVQEAFERQYDSRPDVAIL